MRKNHYILMTCIENVTLFGYLAWNSKFEISFTFCFPMILKYLVLWILKSHYKLHLIFLPSPTSYPVAASMGCPGYPWISLWFQYFRIRRHISPNPATYFDILLNNRTGVQLAGYPYDSKEMPPLLPYLSLLPFLTFSYSFPYFSLPFFIPLLTFPYI